MNSEYLLTILVFLSPAIVGAIIAFAKPAPVVVWTSQFGQWAIRKHRVSAEKTGVLTKWAWRPFLWGLEKIDLWTKTIEGEFVRAGVRVGSYTYYIAVVLYLAYWAILTAVAVVIVVALVLLALWIIGLVLGGAEGRGSGYSEKRTGFFGNQYTQHYDESEQVGVRHEY